MRLDWKSDSEWYLICFLEFQILKHNQFYLNIYIYGKFNINIKL